jgi:succinate dehydrogenase / fumarate reductase, flavoprotein subunit
LYMKNYQEITTDVLIIGQGAAGLRVAIELTTGKVPCLVISKRSHGDAHTKWAAGGINASMANLDKEDTWQIHAADTLREGQYVCNPKAVELLARRAPSRIIELQAWGCPFSLTDEGKINQRYFGAQSFRRTCFIGDRTGEAILKTLVKQADKMNIPTKVNTYISRLLVEDNKVVGAIGFDMETGEQLVFKAKAVVLACGGFASIYNRSSSRHDENTADNVGLGYEAGATLQDMEFVQFHPTGMIKPEHMVGRLVSEAVRGEGGHLLNKDKERFMEKYSPDKMELDARDVVARSIYQEIQEGRGTPDGGVWLDISHKGADYIKERLPKLVDQFKEQEIDFTKEAVEVAPTSHYAMGGLRVNFETGETGVPGLYAVGEATAGVHGANRLGGNSLAETVVFGQLSGSHLLSVIDQLPAPALNEATIQKAFDKVKTMIHTGLALKPAQIITKIGNLLWEHAGIVRDRQGLEAGLEKLKALEPKWQTSIPEREGTPKDWEKACNLYFIMIAAEAVMKGALLRDESRGAHYRKDATESKDEWKKNIYYRYQDGQMHIFTEEVPAIAAEIQQALDKEYSLNYHHLE